jgi:hypothetical protein
MTETILFQEPGVTIVFESKAGTLAPYYASQRPNSFNHGYVELRDNPDLVDTIEEAKESPAFKRILKSLARKGSRYFEMDPRSGTA